jgi:hypothetical protein
MTKLDKIIVDLREQQLAGKTTLSIQELSDMMLKHDVYHRWMRKQLAMSLCAKGLIKQDGPNFVIL